MPPENAGEQPAKGIGHGVKGYAGPGDVHRHPQKRPHGGAGEHAALHGRRHHQQQRQKAAHGDRIHKDEPGQGHQQAGGQDHQGYAVLQLLCLGGPESAGQSLPKKIAAPKGQGGLQKQLRPEGAGRALVGKAPQPPGHDHDRSSRRGQEKPLFDKLLVLEHIAHRVDEHAGRNIAQAPVQAPRDKIAQGRPQQRRHPRAAGSGGGHQGHAEGAAGLQHPGTGHGKAQEKIQAPAGQDPILAPGAHARRLQGCQPLLSVKFHDFRLHSLHKVSSL